MMTRHRKKIAVLCVLLCLCMVGLTGRLVYLMLFCSAQYSQMAEELHQRERKKIGRAHV